MAFKSRIYTPLDTSRNEIRVLQIKSLATDEPQDALLDCSLTVVSLDDRLVNFDALSYAWGEPGATETILLEGQQWEIRRNLFDALMTFRSMIGIPQKFFQISPLLFADALCINQEDLDERSSQVQLMKDIYKRAKMVRVWLGLGGPEVEALFIEAESRGPTSTAAKRKETDSKTVPDVVRNIAENHDSAFVDVMSRTWWQRLWVVQEVLQSLDSIAFCGTSTIMFLKLLDLSDAILKAVEQRSISTRSIKSWSPPALSLAFFEFASKHDELQRRADPIMNVFSHLSLLQVSDPLDRVYGLRSLFDPDLSIRVDYTLSPQDVYQQLFSKMMMEYKSLASLVLCHNMHSEPHWPSWVPDLRNLRSRVDEPEPATLNRGASICGRADFFATIRNQIELVVRGDFIDEIHDVGLTYHKSNEQIEDDIDIAALRTVLAEWHRTACSPDRTRPVNIERSVEFWQTFDRTPWSSMVKLDEVHRPPEVLETIEDLEAWLADKEAALSSLAGAYLRAMKPLSGLTLFLSERGLIAISRSEPRIGDRTAILAGCPAPMILRARCSDDREVFEIVGPCHLEGIHTSSHCNRFSC